MTRFPQLWLALALLVLSLGLRLYKLGDWPFAGDELTTLAEMRTLFGPEAQTSDPQSQVYRMPRVLPVAHSIVYLGATAFGTDEWGSRFIMALLGGVIVPVVFLLLAKTASTAAAFATAVMIALWPEHLYHSQQLRFYMAAFVFATPSLLCGAIALQRRSVSWMTAACILAVVALLSHTVTGAVLGVLLAGVLVQAMVERRRPDIRMLALVGLATVCSGLFVLIHVLPLLRGWNSDAEWGYSMPHAVLAAVNMLGWPTVVLATLGILASVAQRTAVGWYWMLSITAFAVVVIVLPLAITYNPMYPFPLAIGVFVAAGHFVGTVHERLYRTLPWAAVAWLPLACLLTLPSVASHYVDGSRADMRTAARFIEQHWQDGDCVASHSIGTFTYYAPDCQPLVPITRANALETAKKLTRDNGRLWIVLRSGRGGLPVDCRQWLGTHCSHPLHVCKRRFDYLDYCVDVYLFAR